MNFYGRRHAHDQPPYRCSVLLYPAGIGCAEEMRRLRWLPLQRSPCTGEAGGVWEIAKAGGREALSPDQLLAVLEEPVAALSDLGILNFLLSDSVHLLAFANTRLHRVHRDCIVDGCNQTVMVLATELLSDEQWEPLELGRLHCFAAGREVEASTRAGSSRSASRKSEKRSCSQPTTVSCSAASIAPRIRYPWRTTRSLDPF